MADNDNIRFAMDALIDEGSVDKKALFYHAVASGELYMAVASIPSAAASVEVRPDNEITVDVLTSLGPDGKPVLLAFTSLPAESEQQPGLNYVVKPGMEILQLVVDGGFGGVIIDPHTAWAGMPRVDVIQLIQALNAE